MFTKLSIRHAVDARFLYERQSLAVFATMRGDVYKRQAFDNIQSLDKQTIHVAKDVACNIPEKFAIGNRNSGETNGSVLKLELEDGVKLTGSVSLYSADVIVKGSGDTSGFSCVPANDQMCIRDSNRPGCGIRLCGYTGVPRSEGRRTGGRSRQFQSGYDYDR